MGLPVNLGHNVINLMKKILLSVKTEKRFLQFSEQMVLAVCFSIHEMMTAGLSCTLPYPEIQLMRPLCIIKMGRIPNNILQRAWFGIFILKSVFILNLNRIAKLRKRLLLVQKKMSQLSREH